MKIPKHKDERKLIKKSNLAEAKRHFPYRVDIKDKSLIDIKEWLIKNRFRSWKQKGINGDYFTKDNKIYWFKEKDKMILFLLSLK